MNKTSKYTTSCKLLCVIKLCLYFKDGEKYMKYSLEEQREIQELISTLVAEPVGIKESIETYEEMMRGSDFI